MKAFGDRLAAPGEGGVSEVRPACGVWFPERGVVMTRVLLVSLLVLGLPALAFGAGNNPDGRLCMHLVASTDFLYFADDFTPMSIADMNQDLTPVELAAASYSVYVVLCAYNINGLSGIEFAIEGWPSDRGTSPTPSIAWEPDEYTGTTGEEALTQGDIMSGGGITSWGGLYGGCDETGTRVRIRDWWGDDNNTPGTCDVYPFAYIYGDWTAYTASLPVTLTFAASTFSEEPARLYMQDCSVSYEQDDLIPSTETFGCIIGATWPGDVVTAVDNTTWSSLKSLYR